MPEAEPRVISTDSRGAADRVTAVAVSGAPGSLRVCRDAATVGPRTAGRQVSRPVLPVLPPHIALMFTLEDTVGVLDNKGNQIAGFASVRGRRLLTDRSCTHSLGSRRGSRGQLCLLRAKTVDEWLVEEAVSCAAGPCHAVSVQDAPSRWTARARCFHGPCLIQL